MAAKCKIFMDCTKNFKDILEKSLTAKQRILKGSDMKEKYGLQM